MDGNLKNGEQTMNRNIENPMVIDSLWERIDELERQAEEEAWYRRADDDYDEWAAMNK